jgi:hypothetical protein
MFEEEFAKLPIEPPRRVGSLPGLRLWAAVPKWALIMPLFFLSFFGVIPLSLMSADPAMRLAMGTTESSQGRVVSSTSASACRGAASHHVAYSFSSKSGAEYRGAATLCEESPYYSVNAGEAIEVRYLKSDPAVDALPSDGVNQAPPLVFFFFVPVFFFVLFAAMFWPPVGEVLRARRLFKSGRLATGKVVFVKRRALPLWPGISSYGTAEVYVEFQTAAQLKREGVAACRNDWLINHLKPGAQVHVAYSDGNAGGAALLEAYLR